MRDVNLVRETMDTKIWHAETDREPREVTWSNVSGWSIKTIVSPSSSRERTASR